MYRYIVIQSWIVIGRADAETEALILWPPDVRSRPIGKDPDAGKDWRQEEKGMTEDEMVGWHHRFDGHEFKQTPGDSEGQESLACCSPWGHKESDKTEPLNNNRYVLRWRNMRERFIYSEGLAQVIMEAKEVFR